MVKEFNEQLEDRINDFESALNGRDPETWEKVNNFLDWLNDYVLTYEDDPYYRAKRLVLSWGGPGADRFLFFKDGTIEYHCLCLDKYVTSVLGGHNLEIMEQVRDYFME